MEKRDPYILIILISTLVLSGGKVRSQSQLKCLYCAMKHLILLHIKELKDSYIHNGSVFVLIA